MKIQIITIFPEIFESFLQASLIRKAIEKNLLTVTCTQLRDFASPPHFQVDDTPYGGGAGMTMKPEPLFKAVSDARQSMPNARVILLTPVGTPFSQQRAEDLSQATDIIFVCGRYEGIDQRFIDQCVDEEISLGDFILMGGEVATMAVIEAIVRLIPGVIGNQESLHSESFCGQDKLLEAPQYTRPPEYRGVQVPAVLLSGNHEEIAAWRKNQSIALTKKRRPDLLK